jgi:hypothetical protein
VVTKGIVDVCKVVTKIIVDVCKVVTKIIVDVCKVVAKTIADVSVERLPKSLLTESSKQRQLNAADRCVPFYAL